MGDLEAYDDSACGRVGSKSYLLLEDLDIPSDDEDLNDLVLHELGNLYIQDSFCSQPSNIKEDEVVESCLSKPVEQEQLKADDLGCKNPSFTRNSVETNSTPLLVGLKLVSALKGSRALHGKTLDPKLHISWAPDVYDPPVTSSSHTTKAHRQRRPKAHKDHNKHKHKHIKSKSSKSVVKENKHPRRSTTNLRSPVDPRSSRYQLAGFELSKVSALGIAAGRSKEPTCGGSFHMESPWPSSIPLAEAS